MSGLLLCFSLLSFIKSSLKTCLYGTALLSCVFLLLVLSCFSSYSYFLFSYVCAMQYIYLDTACRGQKFFFFIRNNELVEDFCCMSIKLFFKFLDNFYTLYNICQNLKYCENQSGFIDS